MTEQLLKEDNLYIIREIETNPSATQRAISRKLGISLGKTNYLFKELIKKGLIKAKNFTNNPGKLKKINYLLTEKGIEEKLRLLQHFLKRREEEYNLLKKELETVSQSS
ncbi:MAG: MarR family EPS-associated transcriptional regulator [Candidatus Omnitrophica bacterium]|jgi:EPS-associated MarR family transcriptional regulator|nr:MarR family EPS-associated transcriptional regulator [Candidatus Omnitrophota bacterium]